MAGQDAGHLKVEEEVTRTHLRMIALLPKWQRQGIGTEIIRDLIRSTHERGVPLTLWVSALNQGARTLYQRLGFEVVRAVDFEAKGPKLEMAVWPDERAGRRVTERRFHDVEVVTFDFFNTLVHHPPGQGGRGSNVMEYLRTHGLESDPWEHQILYDVFEPHAREYSPAFSPAEKERYFNLLAERLFRRLNVIGMAETADHAGRIWELIGPSCLIVFPDVHVTLERLRLAGFRLAVISNWQCGLGHFCDELGFAGMFDDVLASAELGCEKPASEIFQAACRRLGVARERVLHVGDTPADDIEGARRAGIRAVLVCREPVVPPFPGTTIPSLQEIPALLGIESGMTLREASP